MCLVCVAVVLCSQTKPPLLQQYGDRIVQALVRRSTCLSMNKYWFYIQVLLNTPSNMSLPLVFFSLFLTLLHILHTLVDCTVHAIQRGCGLDSFASTNGQDSGDPKTLILPLTCTCTISNLLTIH